MLGGDTFEKVVLDAKKDVFASKLQYSCMKPLCGQAHFQASLLNSGCIPVNRVHSACSIQSAKGRVLCASCSDSCRATMLGILRGMNLACTCEQACESQRAREMREREREGFKKPFWLKWSHYHIKPSSTLGEP